jgi:hypothetical protein
MQFDENLVPLQGIGVTGSYAVGTLSVTGASATIGSPAQVTYIGVPEVHMHDQQRTQPLVAIEALSMAPLALGIGTYLVVRRGACFVVRMRRE